jgi:serine/threonine protein kinase/WD40 repeat protein
MNSDPPLDDSPSANPPADEFETRAGAAGSDSPVGSAAVYFDAVHEYDKARDAGRTPDPEEWLARWARVEPLIEPRLREFLRSVRLARKIGAEAPCELSDFSFYKVKELLGQGGMGAVFRVLDSRLERPAAMKVPKEGAGSDHETQRRLALEAQVISQLQHPNIVPLFDVGRCRTGKSGAEQPGSPNVDDRGTVPYYVMRIVDGPTLKVVIDKARQKPTHEHEGELRKILADFILVCNAVAFAHAKNVVHRDLKPQNISIGELGQIYVMDWGLSKDFNRYVGVLPSSDDGGRTAGVIGTLDYLAPEMATAVLAGAKGGAGSSHSTVSPHAVPLDIDASTVIVPGVSPGPTALDNEKLSDIYSLGATLYYILTGHPPFDVERNVYRKLAQITAGPPPSPLQRDRRIDKRLQAICLKAMDRNPRERYATPDLLAKDLQSWLNDAPVAAYKDSRREQMARWARHHRALVRSAGLFALILLVLGFSFREWSQFQEVKLAKIERDLEVAKVRADSVKREAASSEYIGLTAQVAREELRRTPGWAERSWGLLQQATQVKTPLRNEVDLRSAAASVLVADELRQKSVEIFPKRCAGAVYSTSGETIALLQMDDTLHPAPTIVLLDAKTGNAQRVLEGDSPGVLPLLAGAKLKFPRSRFQSCVFMDQDRALIAGTHDGRLCRFDLTRKSSRPQKTTNVGTEQVMAWLMPDERFVLTESGTQLCCLDSRTLELVGKPYQMPAKGSAISIPDDESVLVHHPQGTLWLSLTDWKLKESFPTARGASGFHPGKKFHPAGDVPHYFARSWPDGDPLHAYLLPRNEASVRPGHTQPFEITEWLGYSPCGRAFGVGLKSDRGTVVRVWDAWGGLPRWEIPVPSGAVLKLVAIGRDAERIALLTDREVIQHSRIRPRLAAYSTYGHPSGLLQLRMSPDRSELAIVGERRQDGNDALHLWTTGGHPGDLSSRKVLPIGAVPSNALDVVSYSPDNRWFACRSSNGSERKGILLHDRTGRSDEQLIPLQHRLRKEGTKVEMNADAFAGFGWSSDGVLVAAVDYELFAWDLTAQPAKRIGETDSFDLFGRPRPYVALAMNGTETGWALTVRSELRPFRIGAGGFAFRPQLTVPGDGNPRVGRIDPTSQHLAIGRSDGSIVLFRTQSSEFAVPRQEGHGDSVEALAWLNETFLVSGSRDGMLAVWNLTKEGELALRYRIDIKSPIVDIAPTPDGRGVYVAVAEETSLRVYELATIDHELQALFSDRPLEPSPEPGFVPPTDLAEQRFPDGTARPQSGTLSPPDPKQAAGDAAERQVAEWVLSLGGQVGLRDRQGRPMMFPEGRLPETDFQVDSVTLSDAGIDMARLAACRRLSSLVIARIPNLTDAAFAELKEKRIRSLVVDGCPLLSDGAIDTLSSLEGLDSLTLMRVPITDAKLPELKKLTSLRSLTLAETRITDDGLLELGEACPGITQLNIHQSRGGVPGVRGIGRFRKLESLTISGDQFTAEAPDLINSIPSLHVISITAPLSDAVMARVGSLKSVRSLGVSSAGDETATRLSPGFVGNARWPDGIQTLIFNGAAASPRDEDLKALAKNLSLKLIIVGGARGTPKGPRYTSAGFVELRKARPDMDFGIDDGIYKAGQPFPPAGDIPAR